MNIWTQEVVDALVLYWKTDSAAQIAARLSHQFGLALSRSSVIGKIHRLGLSAPQRVRARKEPTQRKTYVRKPSMASSTPEPEPVEVICDVVSLNKTLIELGPFACRYIAGDPRDEAPFCGHIVAENSPYCPTHHALCYAPNLKGNSNPDAFSSGFKRRAAA